MPPGQVLSDSEFIDPPMTVSLQDVYPDLTDTAVRQLVEHDTPELHGYVPVPAGIQPQRLAEGAAAEPGGDL